MANADQRQDEDALEEIRRQTKWEERNRQGNANEDGLPGWR